MAAIGIIDILLPIFVVSILQSDTPFYPKQRQGSTKYYKLAVYVVLGGLAASWARLVTRLVPDPYLVRARTMSWSSESDVSRMKYFIFHKHRRTLTDVMMSGIQSSPHPLACL
jgi:hypothetical protein